MSTLGADTTAWADQWWDPGVGLLWNMPGSFDDHGMAPRALHLIQPSAWYAIGLLQRQGDGDVERAERTIEALCAAQYDAPGTVWHGTFALFLESPEPKEGAVQWVDYDPNWRQFVGTAFRLAIDDFGSQLSASTVERMEAAIALAVVGEPPDRVSPDYTNIALMKAWLEVEAGQLATGEALAGAVVERFGRNGAFMEYGSPTYYGVDLYALALWRRSASARLRDWGVELETAMWRDISRWYQAGLRNLCGPYARSYGMDMTGYASLLGLWIWDAVGRDAAPFPALGPEVGHGADVCFGPVVELLGAAIPDDAVGAFTGFPGAHAVRQVVSEELGFVATGWLDDEVMLGGASGSRARAEGQYHPATMHWRAPDGTVGWLRLVHAGPLDVTVEPRRMTVAVHDHPRRGPQPTVVVSSHTGRFDEHAWSFPGLTVTVDGDLGAGGPSFDTPGGTRFSLAV
jgi:hypothetical protein